MAKIGYPIFSTGTKKSKKKITRALLYILFSCAYQICTIFLVWRRKATKSNYRRKAKRKYINKKK